MRYFVVDAFTKEVFKGNPAGVCILDKWIDDTMMQKIAAENNLSDTAFVVKMGAYYDLRWFTPKAEIDLCGHATLATTYVLSNFFEKDNSLFEFHTASGILKVECNEDLYIMDFPIRMPKQINAPNNIFNAIGVEPKETLLSRDLFVVLETEQQVKNLKPNFVEMMNLEIGTGVIVTAKGDNVDFVSRCFFPKIGINEDPVTGSAHSNLIPYWAEKLNKKNMVAHQLSERGGILYCELSEKSVKISGNAVLYMIGDIEI